MVVNDTYVSKIRIEVLLVPLPATHRIRTHDATSLFLPKATLFSSLDRIILLLAAIIVIILGPANPVDCRQSSVGMCFSSIIEREKVS